MKKKKYSTNDLINFLKDNGLKKESNILIHSSWDSFNNFTDSTEDLIIGLIENFGKMGTIIMPGYFPYRPGNYKKIISKIFTCENKIFDLKKTPTIAGIIPEEFRKFKNVVRSIDYHSVSAFGKHSQFLVKDHAKSITHWDKHSPYFKLSKINGTVLTLGLGPKFVGTILHCADSMLRTELNYFKQFFSKKITQKFRLEDGSIYTKNSLVHADSFYYKFNYNNHSKIIKKYFDQKYYRRNFFSNLSINFYDANYFINQTMELARKGIVFYTFPKFKKCQKK